MMVRHYEKKTKRREWNDGDMQLAIKQVLDGKSCKSVANNFSIPRSTLQKRVFKYIGNNSADADDSSKGFSITFTQEQELALARYICHMENNLMGLDGTEIRKLAYEFAERLNITHRFNRQTQSAGKDWLRNFMSRHDFSHRKAKHTSTARAQDFKEKAVTEFFGLLKDVLEQHNLTPDRIYNVDETRISIGTKTSPKIVTKKGRKQVGGLRAGEGGESVTAEICMSAAGFFMPPMLIFPRVKENPEFLNDAPPGAWAEFNKSGYMQTEISTKWFHRFLEFSQASPDKRVLLLLDCHSIHVKNLDVIDLAQQYGVIILRFPPHCTHKMQPLDVGFDRSLNICFEKEISNFQRQGYGVSLKNLYSIFGKAFITAAKMETAINAFEKCGIYPFKPDVFTENDFAASKEVTQSVYDSSINEESEKRIAKFSEVLNEIVNSTHEYSRTAHSADRTDIFSRSTFQDCSPQSSSINQHETYTEPSAAVNEIQIPVSLITQAEPLINLLYSCLNSQEKNAAKDFRIPTSVVSSVISPAIDTIYNPHISTPSSEFNLNGPNYSLTPVSLFLPAQTIPLSNLPYQDTTVSSNKRQGYLNYEDTPVSSKKRQIKGKTAIITSDMYDEKLFVCEER